MAINRDHIGFFGKMNSGKSSLMNLLTQQETSITDSTPGTTADTKITLQEIHGLGSVKLFDTAGLDETSNLGEKKKQKVLSVLKECDLVILVVDPSTNTFDVENLVMQQARELDKQILVVFNLFQPIHRSLIEFCIKNIQAIAYYPQIVLSAIDHEQRKLLLGFIVKNYESKNSQPELLPFVEPDQFYVLNIPMDDQAPLDRFIRPQAMAEEYITRHWAYLVSYRMNQIGRAHV